MGRVAARRTRTAIREMIDSPKVGQDNGDKWQDKTESLGIQERILKQYYKTTIFVKVGAIVRIIVSAQRMLQNAKIRD